MATVRAPQRAVAVAVRRPINVPATGVQGRDIWEVPPCSLRGFGMYYVNREVLDAVEQALERVRGESNLNENAIAQLAGVPAIEVRAALHAIAERRASAIRSGRIVVDSGEAVSVFLKQYELLLFPFI